MNTNKKTTKKGGTLLQDTSKLLTPIGIMMAKSSLQSLMKKTKNLKTYDKKSTSPKSVKNNKSSVKNNSEKTPKKTKSPKRNIIG